MAETPPPHPTPPPYQCDVCGGYNGWHDADCPHHQFPPPGRDWPVIVVIALVAVVVIGGILAGVAGLIR